MRQPKVYLVDLEAVDTRYTGQWQTHIPALLKENNIDVQVISGPKNIPSATTPGAFLNFGGTNIYKAVQVEQMGRLFTSGSISPNDHFLFTDAWHPGIINLKYMSELLKTPIKIHALWHAGSYDPADFLGRLIGNAPWVRHAEKSFFYAIDHNYFATDFHINMFFENLLNDETLDNPWKDEDFQNLLESKKIIQSGWPMEYLKDVINKDCTSSNPWDLPLSKRDLILFPHRIAPEKQVEIFRDLATHMPEYEWIVCQDKRLTKKEYHQLLNQSKIVFSANLQETLGISCYEALCVGSVPMVPDRLSYTEMYSDTFKYPSEWTQDWNSYVANRDKLIAHIKDTMTKFNEGKLTTEIAAGETVLGHVFFSANKLIENILA